MSLVATSISYSASTTQFSITASVETVGELTSSFEMKSRCLFPTATWHPLTFPSLFCLSNMWDSNISFHSFSVRSFVWRGLKVSMKCYCSISEYIPVVHFLLYSFNNFLRGSWVRARTFETLRRFPFLGDRLHLLGWDFLLLGVALLAISVSCVMITDTIVGFSSNAWLKNMCASGCNVTCCYNWATMVSYLVPLMLGT